MNPTANSMASEENLAWAVLLAPLAGAAAGVTKFISGVNKVTKDPGADSQKPRRPKMSNAMQNPGGRTASILYKLALGFALFSGFGQMPILKRYYFADLPLLGWSADFYILSDMHYWSAALILLLMAWRVSIGGGLFSRSWSWGPHSKWGYTLLTVLIITGAGKVLRNWGLYLPPALLVVLDLAHLGLGHSHPGHPDRQPVHKKDFQGRGLRPDRTPLRSPLQTARPGASPPGAGGSLSGRPIPRSMLPPLTQG